MSNTYDFCIQPPKWQKIFFIVAIIFSVALSVIVTVLWLIFRFDWGLLVGGYFFSGIRQLAFPFRALGFQKG